MSSILSIGSYVDQNTVYLAAKILPRARASRSTFHLAMLLDTSGSMDGGRLTALKRTLHLLVDALVNNDCLTMIAYESTATVVATKTVISTDSRSILHSTIDGLVADGGTNMEAAILELRRAEFSDVDSVFILTDGHVNQGINGSAGLQTLLSRSIPNGCIVNTLGFGADVNARMLSDMAMRSCGSYTFADKDELLPAIIGDIVGGLQSTVGKQGKLSIPTGWTCCELGVIEDGNYMTGPLIAEKPQWVLMKAPTGTDIPPLAFIWKEGSVSHLITYTTSTVSAMEIAEQICRCTVAKAFATASDLVDTGNLSRARRVLCDAKLELDSSIAKDTTFVVCLYAQIDQMIEELLHVSPAVLSSRMASGGATLGNQRGITSIGDPLRQRLFSSPLQVDTSVTMTLRYTQEAEEMDIV